MKTLDLEYVETYIQQVWEDFAWVASDVLLIMILHLEFSEYLPTVP